MLRLEHISKIYPTGEVLKDINWEVKPGDRIGLVGVNGAGKSTQLKIIAGEIEPTAGEIIRPASLHIAYLTQEFEVNPTRTVREEFWTVFTEANQAQQSLAQVHRDMESANPEELDRLINQMDRWQRQFESLDGYGLEAQIEKILPEMGFEPVDGDRLVSAFSGGWQMRMSLGKILLQKPDLLLLDEPTNHLDLETIEWLETYLKRLTTPMVIVSHDREFLDRLCTQIVETERGVSPLTWATTPLIYNKKPRRKQPNSAPTNASKKNWKNSKPLLIAFVPVLPAAPRLRAARNNWTKLNGLKRLQVG
jgi:ATP-binding cassette subfamily F protein 3